MQKKEIQKEEKTIKRPWQANVLIALIIAGMVIISYSIWESLSYDVSKVNYDTSSLSYKPFSPSFSTFSLVNFFGLVLFFENRIDNFGLLFYFVFSCLFLNLFFVIFRRKRINLFKFFIISFIANNIIVLCFYLVFLYFNVLNGFLDYFIFNLMWSILVSCFMLYLQYSCLKHPFYNQKKINKNNNPES